MKSTGVKGELNCADEAGESKASFHMGKLSQSHIAWKHEPQEQIGQWCFPWGCYVLPSNVSAEIKQSDHSIEKESVTI